VHTSFGSFLEFTPNSIRGQEKYKQIIAASSGFQIGVRNDPSSPATAGFAGQATWRENTLLSANIFKLTGKNKNNNKGQVL
jgi:hypothetical protein